MKPKLIDLEAIDFSPAQEAREDTSEAAVKDYSERLDALPPAVVFLDSDGVYWGAEGSHRAMAHHDAGRGKIPCEVRKGTKRDAELHAMGSNSDHGVRRSNADKRKVVTWMLEDSECVKWSDNRIAKHCHVSPPFVAGIRNDLVTKNIVSQPESVVGVDGRETKPSRAPKRTTNPSAEDNRRSQIAEHFGDSCPDATDSGASSSSPEAGPESARSESIVRDALNRTVPGHLTEHHDAAATIQSTASKLDAIKRDIEQIAETPGGCFLQVSELLEGIKDLKGRISQSRYWTECPKCKGEVDLKCKRCSGKGFIPHRMRGLLSAPEKKWLGIDV